MIILLADTRTEVVVVVLISGKQSSVQVFCFIFTFLYLCMLSHFSTQIHPLFLKICFIYEIVGKDISEKTVSNVAHMGDLVNFALDDAAAVEMKYVIERLVALVTIL